MNGRVLYSNDAGRKVFKAEVGKKMPEHYLPILKKAASSGPNVTFEEQVGGRYFSNVVRFIVKANYCNMYSRDITERKEAEKIIEKSAREWQTTFDAIGDVVCVTNLERKVLRCNMAMKNFLKKPLRKIIDQKCWELVHGTSGPIEGCPLERMRKSRHRETAVLPMGERWFHITVDPVLDEADNLMGAVHTMTDITEGKKVQIALESEKRHLEALFKSVPQGIVTAGLNHEVIDINPAFTEVFGYCLEEIKGEDVDEILAPKEKLHEARRITQEYDRGKISTVETYRTRQDGNLIPVEISGAPIIVDGKQIGVYTIYKDISERKKAQEKLQNLSEFRESVIENASVWLNVLDAKGNVVIWNKAAERISGYSRKEVLRHDKIWEWLYPDEEYRKEILETVSAVVEKGKVAEDSETRIRCKNGQTRMISWNSRNLLDEKGNPIGSVALGRDITDRKKAEAKVQRTLGKLRRVLRATIQAMVMTVEMRDAYTAGHQRRVT
ncbi:PAS domain S-box protein, partial [candidate division WOR-3 bacterium]|nr:PAS domain S-box protein [candidate division WOR-3 bacterium]